MTTLDRAAGAGAAVAPHGREGGASVTKFEWQGKEYEFDSQACYDGPGAVLLPDGQALEVTSWLESSPPQVGGLRALRFGDRPPFFEKNLLPLTQAAEVAP